MAAQPNPIRWALIFGGHQFFVMRLEYKCDGNKNVRPYVVLSRPTLVDSSEHPVIAIMTYMMLKDAATEFTGTDYLKDKIPKPLDPLFSSKSTEQRSSEQIANQTESSSNTAEGDKSKNGGDQDAYELQGLMEVRPV
jgi:hypothetical protein